MQSRFFAWCYVSLVVSTIPGMFLSAKAQVLNCANVQINPQTGVAQCSEPPVNPSSSITFSNNSPANAVPVPIFPPSGLPSNGNSDIGSRSATPTNGAIDYQTPAQSSKNPIALPVSKYEQLALGMSLEQVQLVLGGQTGRSVDQLALPTGASQTAYQWQFSNGAVTVYFINGQLSAKSSNLSNSGTATLDPTRFLATMPTSANSVIPSTSSIAASLPASGEVNFDAYGQLADGMNFAQAVSILGSLGREVVRNQAPTGEPVVVYKWQAPQGSITLIFQGDRLVTKARCEGCSF